MRYTGNVNESWLYHCCVIGWGCNKIGNGWVAQESHKCRDGYLLLIRILGLVEQEIGSKFLVLVARKVSLDDKIAFETKAT